MYVRYFLLCWRLNLSVLRIQNSVHMLPVRWWFFGIDFQLIRNFFIEFKKYYTVLCKLEFLIYIILIRMYRNILLQIIIIANILIFAKYLCYGWSYNVTMWWTGKLLRYLISIYNRVLIFLYSLNSKLPIIFLLLSIIFASLDYLPPFVRARCGLIFYFVLLSSPIFWFSSFMVRWYYYRKISL